MAEIKIYFDGGAVPNPGKAYGSYEIVSERLNHKALRQQFGDCLTNNQAEYQSLIAALKWLRHHALDADSLEIFTDSQLVANQINRRWKVKVLHIRELVNEALGLLSKYRSWRVKWHRRHNNIKRFGH